MIVHLKGTGDVAVRPNEEDLVAMGPQRAGDIYIPNCRIRRIWHNDSGFRPAKVSARRLRERESIRCDATQRRGPIFVLADKGEAFVQGVIQAAGSLVQAYQRVWDHGADEGAWRRQRRGIDK